MARTQNEQHKSNTDLGQADILGVILLLIAVIAFSAYMSTIY